MNDNPAAGSTRRHSPSRVCCSRCCWHRSTRRSSRRRCRRSSATSAGSTSSRGSSPPTCSRRPSRCRSAAGSSDLYGRKRLFLAAIVVFLAGSALCGLAQTLGQLIAFRALQGLGAGGLMTLAMAIVGDIVPPRERGRYQGYIQLVFVLASVAGPLLGGLFADHAELALGLLRQPADRRAALILIGIDAAPARRAHARSSTTSAPRCSPARSPRCCSSRPGAAQYAWTRSRSSASRSPRSAARRVRRAGAARAGADPAAAAVPRPRLRHRLGRAFLTACAFFAAIVFMPLFLQIVTGASATTSGLLLLPLLLGAAAEHRALGAADLAHRAATRSSRSSGSQ